VNGWVGLKNYLAQSVTLVGPSDAHHIKQGSTYTCVALCKDCHQGPIMGWHGQKRMWAIQKMDELDALKVTIERLLSHVR